MCAWDPALRYWWLLFCCLSGFFHSPRQELHKWRILPYLDLAQDFPTGVWKVMLSQVIGTRGRRSSRDGE